MKISCGEGRCCTLWSVHGYARERERAGEWKKRVSKGEKDFRRRKSRVNTQKIVLNVFSLILHVYSF